ncbi:hypothetical protein [Cohnella sp.]|uniref:hypothetical protein n=1 Tax=Cohnella sp. TaxID=1883426 RepID=UPI0035667BA6
MLTIRNFEDPHTSVPIRALGNPGSNTGHNYFTAMTWLSDSRHLVLYTDINEEKMGVCVKADSESGSAETVAERLEWARGLVSVQDRFYYYEGPRIYEYDLRTGGSRTVCTLGKDGAVYGPLSITNDGRTMGIYWRDGSEWAIGTVDTETGRLTEPARPSFAEPYSVANHAMVNPEDGRLVFFAHEGKTEHIPDRIYMADAVSGEVWNAYRQARLDTGEHVEYVGHEMWSPDGEHLYFVKYPQSPLKPTGIYRVHKRTGEAEFINGDYAYWHVSLSPDGCWAVADTIEDWETSKIVLINLRDRSSRLLCEQPMWPQHPGHPHPSFSPDSRKISFTLADENRHLWVGVIERGA